MAKYNFSSLQPEYARLWASMQIKPEARAAATREARQVIAGKSRYKIVEGTTGVPWFVVGCIHMREAAGKFHLWLHNGDPMRDRAGNPIRTRRVPPNRPPNPNVDWETGAYDALAVVQGYKKGLAWGPERVAYVNEDFNGWGYRYPSRNIPSPYLWGGTNIQKRGKFIKDGVYDANTMDSQIGAMAVLKIVMELDPEARFAPPAPKPVLSTNDVRPIDPLTGDYEPRPAEPPVVAPKAQDLESETKPVVKSKTIWSGIGQAALSVGSAASGAFAYINNPYAVTAFGIIAAVALILVYLNIRGYLDIRAIVTHLSDDDPE